MTLMNWRRDSCPPTPMTNADCTTKTGQPPPVLSRLTRRETIGSPCSALRPATTMKSPSSEGTSEKWASTPWYTSLPQLPKFLKGWIPEVYPNKAKESTAVASSELPVGRQSFFASSGCCTSPIEPPSEHGIRHALLACHA